LDGSTSGNVNTITVSGAVISTLWRNEDGWRRASIVGAVTADVIFNANSSSENSEWISGVRAPSALESFGLTLGQTVRAVEDTSKVLARKRRRVDCDVASRSLVFDSSSVVIFADASVVDAGTVSRTELSFVVARRDGGSASVKFSSRALLVGLASTIDERGIGIKRNSSSWAPGTGKVQVVRNTSVAISIVEDGKIVTSRRRRWEYTDSKGTTIGTVPFTSTTGKGGISSYSG